MFRYHQYISAGKFRDMAVKVLYKRAFLLFIYTYNVYFIKVALWGGGPFYIDKCLSVPFSGFKINCCFVTALHFKLIAKIIIELKVGVHTHM
jgi:hypothetical protein